MEFVTRGDAGFVPLETETDLRVSVRAPGMHVAWRTGDSLSQIQGVEGTPNNEWTEAIAEHGLEEVASVGVEPLAVDLARTLTITGPGSLEPHAELRAVAEADDGLLLMVENDGIVQWYLPTSASPELIGLDAEAGPGRSREVRFLVPQSTLLAGPGEGFGFGFGAIVKFFRFKFAKDLIGKGVEKVIEWIVDKVESKAKPREGFRWFRKEQGFPFVTDAQLAALKGQRCLLLTHGIFSSLEGAFSGIADPASDVMIHLRSVYGDNILGWDHWTVGKTPLENAAEMLNALPEEMSAPDMMCHSRGALVNRAALEIDALLSVREARFKRIGKAIFVAGASQGSHLASEEHINRLLNIYSAIGSLPILGSAGVALKVVVGVLKVLAHGAAQLPSVRALSSDIADNEFIQGLNGPLMTPADEIVVVHANYDPSSGPLAKFLDLNVDQIFGEANDMVVPFIGAEVLDKGQKIGTNFRFGSASQTQGVVMHTNFFSQRAVQDLIRAELT